MKFIVKLACCFLVIGIIMGIAGTAMGGASVLTKPLIEGYNKYVSDYGYSVVITVPSDQTFVDSNTMQSIMMDEDMQSALLYDDDVDKINIHMASGDLYIEYDLALSFSGMTESREDDDEYKLTGDGGDMVLYLPMNFAGKLELNIAGGSVISPNLMAQELDIDLIDGSLVVDNVQTEELDVDIAAGSCQLGRVEFTHGDIEIGAGEMSMTIAQYLRSYQYEMKVDTGAVYHNDNVLVNAASGKIENKSGEYELDVKVGAGRLLIFDNAYE